MQTDLFTTLSEAQTFVAENIVKGVVCPCCHQLAKVYRYKLNRQIAMFLIWLFKQPGKRGHHRDFLRKYPQYISKQYSLAKHWGLIVPDESTNGSWILTDKGARFVRKETRIAKYVYIFDDKIRGNSIMENKFITIEQALQEEFNLDEMMNFPQGEGG